MGRLHGTVTLSPTTPVCQTGKPCSKPVRGGMLNFDRRGSDGTDDLAFVAKDGTYSNWLAPGVYTVIWGDAGGARPGLPGPRTEPSPVRVVAGQTRRVDFRIDTGIR